MKKFIIGLLLAASLNVFGDSNVKLVDVSTNGCSVENIDEVVANAVLSIKKCTISEDNSDITLKYNCNSKEITWSGKRIESLSIRVENKLGEIISEESRTLSFFRKIKPTMVVKMIKNNLKCN